MPKRSEYFGIELDWFAIDSDGFIALMSSAGFGAVPDAVFANFEAQELIEKKLAALVGLNMRENLPRVLRELAVQGVFSYDWGDQYVVYQRVGVPACPKTFGQLGLPSELLAGFVQLPFGFARTLEFRPQTFLLCSDEKQ